MARGDFQPDAAGQGAPPDCGQAPGWANFYRVTFMPSSRMKSKPESNLRFLLFRRLKSCGIYENSRRPFGHESGQFLI